MNYVIILREVMKTSGIQLDKFFNLESSTSPIYTTTMHKMVQSSRVMKNILLPPHTPS